MEGLILSEVRGDVKFLFERTFKKNKFAGTSSEINYRYKLEAPIGCLASQKQSEFDDLANMIEVKKSLFS